MRIILEILGRPAEHVLEALNGLVEKLSKEKGVVISKKIVHEAVPVKDSKDLFTSFAEIETEIDTIEVLMGVAFAYMPSNIEIISPETINITNADFNDLANRTVNRLHDYDAITKKTLFERDAFARKLKEVAPHLFKNPEQPKQSATINESKPKKDKSSKKKKK